MKKKKTTNTAINKTSKKLVGQSKLGYATFCDNFQAIDRFKSNVTPGS